MNPSSWALRPRPEPEDDAHTLGRWEPAGPADLTAGRRQLAAALHDGARPLGADDDGIERLLLAYEELTSNALRHGHGRVEVTVTTDDTCWLLEVSDATADRPPDPAIGRDPAQGGLGLHLVARICAAHGWAIDGDRKIVWARIDHTLTGTRTASRTRAARPRGARVPGH
jgi:Histidine kinase-like ATPase domain